MSFNNLKLELLLGFLLNYYFKNYSCQHCTCNCHHYKLLYDVTSFLNVCIVLFSSVYTVLFRVFIRISIQRFLYT